MMRHNGAVRAMVGKLRGLVVKGSVPVGEEVKAVMREMMVVIPGYVEEAVRGEEKGRVFREVMREGKLEGEEGSLYRLSGEGFNFLLAGTETTAVSFACSPSFFRCGKGRENGKLTG